MVCRGGGAVQEVTEPGKFGRIFAAPAADDIEPFWRLAAEIAHRIEEGFRVFIHCGAGIGRTGMLAVAVLMMTGKTFGQSMEEISRAGSVLETDAQKSLLEAGVPGGFTEPPNDDHNTDTRAATTRKDT